MKSIEYAHRAVLSGTVRYITSMGFRLRAGAFNSEDNLEDDFRRILETNPTSESDASLINRTTLPFLIISARNINDDPIVNSPRNRKWIYRTVQDDTDYDGRYRTLTADFVARVYVTTYLEALGLLESLYLYEDSTFKENYTIDWLAGSHIVTIQPLNPEIQKVSGLQDKGQIFKVTFGLRCRHNVYQEPQEMRLVEQVNVKLYNLRPEPSLSDEILLEEIIVIDPDNPPDPP